MLTPRSYSYAKQRSTNTVEIRQRVFVNTAHAEGKRRNNAHVSVEHKASFYVTWSRSDCDASMSGLSGRLGKPMSAEFSPSGKFSGKLFGEGLLCGRGYCVEWLLA